MTDRYHSLTVVLEKDVREDDAAPLMDAIRLLEGVLDVSPHVASIEAHMAGRRARQKMSKALMDIIDSFSMDG